jgi:putative FmdB family regulatory protein
MPTYDYACAGCGHRLDVFQSIKDAPLRKCPKCRKPRLKRLIGAGAGVIFKGSGFYSTDYRSPSYETSKKSDTASESRSETCGKPACETGGCQATPPPAKKARKR